MDNRRSSYVCCSNIILTNFVEERADDITNELINAEFKLLLSALAPANLTLLTLLAGMLPYLLLTDAARIDGPHLE